MNLSQFKKTVEREFGPGLKHLTPANSREFLDRVQKSEIQHSGAKERIVLNQPEASLEGVTRAFLSRVLELPPDEAAVRLWIYCLELSSASVAELEADRFEALFKGLGDPSEPSGGE